MITSAYLYIVHSQYVWYTNMNILSTIISQINNVVKKFNKINYLAQRWGRLWCANKFICAYLLTAWKIQIYVETH